MRVHLCGVRGSDAAPGAAFARFGGRTSCVAVAHDGEAPTLVLDGGSGLRTLSEILGDVPFRGTILLGHLHWDHHVGLPFFASGDRDDARVTVAIPAQGDALAVLSRAVSPPHFPLRLDELRGDWRFVAADAGEHRLEGFDVLALDIPHKGGRTFGFRVDDGTGTIAYLSDHSPTSLGAGPTGNGVLHEVAMTLARGVDVLVHDAQYTAEDLPGRGGFGHSTIEYALELAAAAGVSQLVLFHHDPARTDDQLDAIVAALPVTPFTVTAAVEGSAIDIVSSPDRHTPLKGRPASRQN